MKNKRKIHWDMPFFEKLAFGIGMQEFARAARSLAMDQDFEALSIMLDVIENETRTPDSTPDLGDFKAVTHMRSVAFAEALRPVDNGDRGRAWVPAQAEIFERLQALLKPLKEELDWFLGCAAAHAQDPSFFAVFATAIPSNRKVPWR